jgi:hypothetical protein
MEETLRELADEFKSRMQSALKTKGEIMNKPWPYHKREQNARNSRYWIGKEQAFYEAWQTVEAKIKEVT